MSTDLIRYDLLVQDALRSVVRKVLTDTSKDGVPGEHHYYVSFLTHAPGVRVSNRLREKYPHEMTIVLQHQFWDLGVTEHTFEVGLAFGGIPERLLVPFEAVSAFYDPSVQFGLKFEVAGMEVANTDSSENAAPKTKVVAIEQTPVTPIKFKTEKAKSDKIKSDNAKAKLAEPTIQVEGKSELSETTAAKPQKKKSSDSKADSSKPDEAPDAPASKEAASKPTADVVSLDAFRKKS